ncbi:MAG: antibiotic biosynthesis monooxygenase family protein [Ginsengibacter sp.]
MKSYLEQEQNKLILCPGLLICRYYVLQKEEDAYLIISHWEDEQSFKGWTKSATFLDGHKRGFSDLAKAKAEGKEPPMKSDFKTYEVIAR